MSSSTRRKADVLFEEFVTAYFAGQTAIAQNFLARCPEAERQRFEEAVSGFIFAYESYACRVDETLISSALDRLRQVRLKKQKFADASARLLAQSWDHEVTEPLSKMQRLLYPENLAGVPSRVSVLHRESPGFNTNTDKSLDRTLRRADERFAQSEAERLLLRVGITKAPIPLNEVAEFLCLAVQETPMHGLEGCLVTDGDIGGILINSEMPDVRRRRFTLAHEIGHFFLRHYFSIRPSAVSGLQTKGKDEEILSFSDNEGEIYNPKSRHEIEASAFASYLLLPASFLPEAFGRDVPSLDIAEDVSETFDVSLMAVIKRLVQASSYKTAYVSSDGQRVRGVDFSQEFDGYNHVVEQIPKGSVAWELRDKGRVGTVTREVNASTWFDRGRLALGRISILEESRRFETGHTYTLLNILD